MTRWKLVPCEPENAMLEAMWGIPPASQDDAMMMVDDYKRLLSASPSPGEDVVERVAALLGREIYCGQDEAAPADNPCKKTWAAYKRRCPECALHPNERTDLARAVIAALEG